MEMGPAKFLLKMPRCGVNLGRTAQEGVPVPQSDAATLGCATGQWLEIAPRIVESPLPGFRPACRPQGWHYIFAHSLDAGVAGWSFFRAVGNPSRGVICRSTGMTLPLLTISM